MKLKITQLQFLFDELIEKILFQIKNISHRVTFHSRSGHSTGPANVSTRTRFFPSFKNFRLLSWKIELTRSREFYFSFLSKFSSPSFRKKKSNRR